MEQAWRDAFIDFGLLYAISWAFSFAWFASVVIAAGKPWNVIGMFAETICGAGVGASIGLYPIEKVGIRSALATAVLFSCGIISREWIKDIFRAIVYRIFGVGHVADGKPSDSA